MLGPAVDGPLNAREGLHGRSVPLIAVEGQMLQDDGQYSSIMAYELAMQHILPEAALARCLGTTFRRRFGKARFAHQRENDMTHALLLSGTSQEETGVVLLAATIEFLNRLHQRRCHISGDLCGAHSEIENASLRH